MAVVLLHNLPDGFRDVDWDLLYLAQGNFYEKGRELTCKQGRHCLHLCDTLLFFIFAGDACSIMIHDKH